ANLSFSGGTHNLTGASFSNAGAINFDSGTANFNAPVTIGGTVNLYSSTVNFNAASSLTGPFTIYGGGGTVGGTGQVAASNATWTGGSLANTGGLFIPSGGSLSITPDITSK